MEESTSQTESLRNQLVGQRIGSYRILNTLGSGGMSTVYKAVHVDTGHVVALKVLIGTLSRSSTLLQRSRARGAPAAHPLSADISDPAEGRRLVVEAVQLAGRIDLWVNNAGIAPQQRRDLLETTTDSWDQVVGTNLRGPFFLSQAVAAEMLRQVSAGLVSEPQIIFITSISSRFASVNRGEYCVAKAGLSMVAQLFATRLAGTGIRVHEVRPGLIDTDMTRAVRAAYDERIAAGLIPMRRWGTAEDVGRAVALIADGGLPYSTGTVIDVDGGLGLRAL